MKTKMNLLAASAMAATILTTPVSADDHMPAPSWGKVETIACQYNDGKSLADLMGVASKWNSWSNERGLNNYFAWVLTPHYHSELNGGKTAFWFGASPSAQAMGQAKDDWVANGGALAEFNEVWTCGAQSLSTSMIVRPQAPLQIQVLQSSTSPIAPSRTENPCSIYLPYKIMVRIPG